MKRIKLIYRYYFDHGYNTSEDVFAHKEEADYYTYYRFMVYKAPYLEFVKCEEIHDPVKS